MGDVVSIPTRSEKRVQRSEQHIPVVRRYVSIPTRSEKRVQRLKQRARRQAHGVSIPTRSEKRVQLDVVMRLAGSR